MEGPLLCYSQQNKYLNSASNSSEISVTAMNPQDDEEQDISEISMPESDTEEGKLKKGNKN